MPNFDWPVWQLLQHKLLLEIQLVPTNQRNEFLAALLSPLRLFSHTKLLAVSSERYLQEAPTYR